MPSKVCSPACRYCSQSGDRGLSRCLYCGSALSVGRQPSEREQYETSRAAIDERQTQIVHARRTKDDFDQKLMVALNAYMSPTAEFTHDYIARLAGLNTSACQFALRRLQKKGLVRVTGAVNVRSNRKIPQWQFLLPLQAMQTNEHRMAPAPEAPPGHAEVQTNRFNRRRKSVA